MSTLLTLLVTLAAVAATGAAVLGWWRARVGRQRSSLQAMAARRRWSLTWTPADFGRSAQLRLQPRGGLPWTLEVRNGATDFTSEEPIWATGQLRATSADTWDRFPPPFGRDVAGDRAGQPLHPVALPDRAEMILLESDADPARRVVLADLAHALRRGSEELGPGAPALALGPGGFRVRAPVALRDADTIETLVDHAQELARLFGPDG